MPIARIATHSRRAPAVLHALAVIALAWAAGSTPARGAIHVCPTADGTTVFQDRPCERTKPAAAVASSRRARSPLGIDDSWFVRPTDADVVARCDPDGCRCEGTRRPFDSGLALAVADALYLDGAWHRHDGAVAARAQARMDGPSLDELRSNVDAAACDVLISQRILRAHASDVLAGLRRRAREAEERGHDDGRACADGDVRACESLDALTLYRRMVADLVALRSPRGDAPSADVVVNEADRTSR